MEVIRSYRRRLMAGVRNCTDDDDEEEEEEEECISEPPCMENV